MKYPHAIAVSDLHGSHPARGAWIEMIMCSLSSACPWSHPARGAWIEICVLVALCGTVSVAPRKGCVD